MAHDYKYAGRDKPARKPVPTWTSFTIGMLVGAFAMFLVYLQMQAPQKHLVSKKSKKEAESAQSATAPKTDAKQSAEEKSSGAHTPRFDFYTILPELEVIIPEQEITDAPGRPEPGAPATTPGTTETEAYILQAGSFRKYEEADRLRASLALLGIESSIQTVTVNERDVWHRVRVGPIKDKRQLNKLRKKLQDNAISAILLKVKS